MNNIQITGSAADSPVIQTPYTFAYFEAATCQFNCPVAMPWTEWTCHCGPGANDDNIPKCCGATRKRFRGCLDAVCDDEISCKSAGQEIAVDSYATNCNKYSVDNGADPDGAAFACQNEFETEPQRAFLNLITNTWWDDDWKQGADLRKKVEDTANPGTYVYPTGVSADGEMTEEKAAELLRETWTAAGLMTKYNLDNAALTQFMA